MNTGTYSCNPFIILFDSSCSKVLRRLDFDGSDEANRKKAKLKLERMQKDFFHHNIIRLYEVFEAESSIYIVTEYCEVRRCLMLTN